MEGAGVSSDSAGRACGSRGLALGADPAESGTNRI